MENKVKTLRSYNSKTRVIRTNTIVPSEFELCEFYRIYNKLNLNTQVTYIYCASNIYLKFFLCATTFCKWHMYEIVTVISYQFINMSMYLLYKFKQVYFFNSLFTMLLPGTHSKLKTL